MNFTAIIILTDNIYMRIRYKQFNIIYYIIKYDVNDNNINMSVCVIELYT